jgi:hypothetical protein
MPLMPMEIEEKRGRIVVDGMAIRRKSGYDGSGIWETAKCGGCEFKKTLEGKTRTFDLCLWGVAWKIILETEQKKGCMKAGRPSPSPSWLREKWEEDYFWGEEQKPGVWKQLIFPQLSEIMKPPGKAAIGVGRRRIAYDKLTED